MSNGNSLGSTPIFHQSEVTFGCNGSSEFSPDCACPSHSLTPLAETPQIRQSSCLDAPVFYAPYRNPRCLNLKGFTRVWRNFNDPWQVPNRNEAIIGRKTKKGSPGMIYPPIYLFRITWTLTVTQRKWKNIDPWLQDYIDLLTEGLSICFIWEKLIRQ